MHMSSRARNAALVMIAPLLAAALLAFGLTAPTAASAARAAAAGAASRAKAPAPPPCQDWTGASSPVNPGAPGDANDLSSVAVVGTCNSWAVGYYNTNTFDCTSDQTLIEHWGGLDWTQFPGVNPGGCATDSVLTSVAAADATHVWAVGYYYDGHGDQTLVEQWKASTKTWVRVPSANLGTVNAANELTGVAVQGGQVWAVGFYSDGTADQTLTEHLVVTRTGSSFRPVKSPDAGGTTQNNVLNAVAVGAGPGNIWAVGDYTAPGTSTRRKDQQVLVERYKGGSWSKVPANAPGEAAAGSTAGLNSVSSISADDVWAVGQDGPSTDQAVLVEHWDGHRWSVPKTKLPKLTSAATLSGVVAQSDSSAKRSPDRVWAVGYYDGDVQSLLLYWDGLRWTQLPSPDPKQHTNQLLGIGAASLSNLWAVGYADQDGTNVTMAVHCC
jgi:hypothetical protein